MANGKLWFDDSGRTFRAKLKDALAYYEDMGFFPTQCIGGAKDPKARRYSGKTVHGILSDSRRQRSDKSPVSSLG